MRRTDRAFLGVGHGHVVKACIELFSVIKLLAFSRFIEGICTVFFEAKIVITLASIQNFHKTTYY